MEPDFSDYSLDELKSCLQSIDKTKYPERVNQIKSLIQRLEERETQRINSIPASEKQEMKKSSRRSIFTTLIMGAFICSYIVFSGSFPTRSGTPISAEEDPILFYGALLALIGIFLYSCVSIYDKRFNR